jgi:hypothetical protein
MIPLHLQRHIDVNETSGTGRVWEGVEFSNGWVAGTWLSATPSYGWYPSLEHLTEIHGHQGATEIKKGDIYQLDGNREFCYVYANNPEDTTDGNPWVAEGMRFNKEWIVLMHLSKYTSVYWYRSLEELEVIVGKRSHVILNSVSADFYFHPSPNHPVWKREKVFK